MSRRLVRIALALAAPILALLVLRAFYCDVYRVDSGSMEPTLHGDPEEGELVLVRYAGDPRPERFDLVVLRREGARAPFIKRVVGLPGERVQIVGGDLLINGARLPAAGARPAPVPVFDDRRQAFADDFEFSEQLWSQTPDGWRLEHSGPERQEERGLACYRHPVTDSYPGADGEQVRGLRDVGDLVLECEVRLEQPDGVLVWSVTEGGDRFEARYEAGEVLLVRTGRGPEQVLAQGQLVLGLNSWRRARLANLDGHLSFELGDLRLTASYQADSLPVPRHDASYQHLVPRACLGGGGVRASFRAVRLLRDLHYTELGSHGIGEALELGPGELFVLGDNSAGSVDSREWGAVRLGQVIGFAEAVVWPPTALRVLGPVAEQD